MLKNPWPYCENPGDVPWLLVDTAEGATAAGQTDAITVSVDGSNVADGRHFAAICLTTNDPARQTIVIPVTFNHGVPTAADALFRDRFKAE